jgi:hypothetical protein
VKDIHRLLLFILAASLAGLWLFTGYEFQQQQIAQRETLLKLSSAIAALRTEQLEEASRRR